LSYVSELGRIWKNMLLELGRAAAGSAAVVCLVMTYCLSSMDN